MSQPAPTPTPSGSLGSPRDVQGILALIVIIGAFVIAGVAIYLSPSNVTAVLGSVLPLASVVIGFYFGSKSQQQATQQTPVA